jgi:hypothetical protein
VTIAERRRIPLNELLRAGLMHTEPPPGAGQAAARPNRTGQGTSSGYPAAAPDGYLDLILGRLDDLSLRIEQLASAVAQVEAALKLRDDTSDLRSTSR